MDRYQALIYVWNTDETIRKWYVEQFQFDIQKITPGNCRYYGVGQHGDLIDGILDDGIENGIIRDSPLNNGTFEKV